MQFTAIIANFLQCEEICFFARQPTRDQGGSQIAPSGEQFAFFVYHPSRASADPLAKGVFLARYSRVAEKHRKMLPLRKQFAFARVRSHGMRSIAKCFPCGKHFLRAELRCARDEEREAICFSVKGQSTQLLYSGETGKFPVCPVNGSPGSL